MDLDQQIQLLIENAPQDGTTPEVVKAIAPALKALAEQLQNSQYYILQTNDEQWVSTVLRSLEQPEVEKQVLYAYPTARDAAQQSQTASGMTTVAVPLPITHILFQALAIQPLDSIVFLEVPGSVESGVEVKREEIQGLVQAYLQRYQENQVNASKNSARVSPSTSQIPPDIA
ncbi:MAG: hypothetical protein ACFBSC_20180 [Microcoleaceae cyanobacterium]